MLMPILTKGLTWAKAHGHEVAIVGAVGLAFFAGWELKPGGKTVTVTEYKDRIVTQEKVVTVEKPVVQFRDRVTTRTVYRTGPVQEVDHSETHAGKVSEGKETRTDVARTEEVASVTKVVKEPEGRWNVRALAGLDSRGGVVAGGGAEYRVLGPLTLGAWVTVPVAGSAGVTAGASIGLRF